MSKIAWCDITKNPIVGCSKISPGCANCYAETASSSGRLQQFDRYQGIVDKQGHWTGEVRFVPEVLEQILRIKKPQRIFLPSMSDPFHEAVKYEWLDQIFATIALCPHLTFQMLTKRPERMLEYMSNPCTPQRVFEQANEIDPEGQRKIVRCKGGWPFPHVWLGVSIENQKTADERIPLLLQTPAAVRFLSCEPLLEAIDLRLYLPPMMGKGWVSPYRPVGYDAKPLIHQVIVGGESGKDARSCHIDRIRSIIQQCKVAQVACFVKQLGSLPLYSFSSHPASVSTTYLKLRDRKGGNPDEWPEDLRVREFPG